MNIFGIFDKYKIFEFETYQLSCHRNNLTYRQRHSLLYCNIYIGK